MSRDQYRGLVEQLRQSDDEMVARVGRSLGDVFMKRKKCPPGDLLDRCDEIDDAVHRWFPTQFAESYLSWRSATEALNADFQKGADPRSGFMKATNELIVLWKRTLDFLPFLFTGALNRFPKAKLESVAQRELSDALALYERVFEGRGGGKALESDQYLLIQTLLGLFRKLDRAGLVGDGFLLFPLFQEEGRNFESLFPQRFGEILGLIGQVRNRFIHDQLGDKGGEDIQAIHELTSAAFLDVIDTLVPVCRAYFLVYLKNLDRQDGEAIGLAFDGVRELKRVRFLLSGEVVCDAESIEENALYMIARDRAVKSFGKTEPLRPRDYLCMTPFMVFVSPLPPGTSEPGGEAPGGDRKLFLFKSYDKRTRRLHFLEFAGRSEARGFSPDERLDLVRVFEKYDLFLRDLEELVRLLRRDEVAAEPAPDQAPSESGEETVTQFRERAREISADHLRSVLDIASYDDQSNLLPEAFVGGRRRKFDERLYVAPSEAAIARRFLTNCEQRGLVFVGRSGIGKSNLLCKVYLTQQRDAAHSTTIPVFLDARRLGQSEFLRALERAVGRRLEPHLSLPELDRKLGSLGLTLRVFLDSVNEHGGTGGPLQLLETLVDAVCNPTTFQHLQVIVTCRTETWAQYKSLIQEDRHVLSPRHFLTDGGDAFFMSGFGSEEDREALFDAYQQRFDLQPTSYSAQGEDLKGLIREPFMMGLIADVYSNRRPEGESGKRLRIGRRLDYFRLFRQLTPRRIEDAKRQMGVTGAEADLLALELEQCLLRFSEILFDQLTRERPHLPGREGLGPTTDDTTDSIPFSFLAHDREFAQFLRSSSARSGITVFDVAQQVGLITGTRIEEVNSWDQPVHGRAYRFFHDRYTEYWLAAIYRRSHLGTVSTKTLEADPKLHEKVKTRIRHLVDLSVRSNVLAGAVEHWLFANMARSSRGVQDYLLPLLEDLMRDGSEHMRQLVSVYLHSLPDRGVVAPGKLYPELCGTGSPSLKRALAEHIVCMWPDYPPDSLRSLIESLDEEEDDFVILAVADALADLFALEPNAIRTLIAEALHGVNAISPAFLLRAATQRPSLQKHLGFFAKFAVKAALDNFEHAPQMSALRELVRDKFKFVLKSVLTRNPGPFSPSGVVQRRLFAKLEDVGVNQWDQAIGAQGDNNTFFLLKDGVRQRDLIHDYFPYVIDFHNGDLDGLSLEPGSRFRELSVRMMDYRQASVVGFVATLILAGVAHARGEGVDDIAEELLASGSESAIFYLVLLLGTLGRMDPERAPKIMEYTEKRILPILVDGREVNERHYGSLILAAMDLDKLWPAAERILHRMLDELAARGNEFLIGFGSCLREACFHPDIELGVRIAESLLARRGIDSGDNWRTFVLDVLAGLEVRNPAVLRELLARHSLDEQVAQEIRSRVTADTARQKDAVSYQLSWCRLLAASLTQEPQMKKLRYYVVKHMFAGIAQGNSVRDCAKGFRAMVVEAVRGFLGEEADEEKSYSLTVEEAFAAAETTCKYGVDGERWTRDISEAEQGRVTA